MSEEQLEPGVSPAGLALAGELRAIIGELTSNEVEESTLLEAGELARRLRALLDGPRRARWYERGDHAQTFSPTTRSVYHEQSPIRGHLNPVAPPLELQWATRANDQPCLHGRARLGAAYEGPPRGAHGGWVAALFDEILGAALALVQSPSVTAILTVKYRALTPLDEELHLEAWVHEQRARRTVIHATCHAGDTLTAEAEGIFVKVDFDRIKSQMGIGP